jgi:trk system potassium uptake protein TrkA
VKVVVAGAGNMGRHLAIDLAKRGNEVTVIEQETGPAQRARSELPESVTVLLGDACEPYVLEEAKLGQADVIVAATGDDEDNLVISLLAKQEFAVPRVLARVNHPQNEWMFTEQWGVDVAVSPPHILTSLVEEAVSVGDLVRLLKLQRGQVTLVELTLEEHSQVAGRPMYELRLPLDSAIVAIVRDEHVVIPQPETVLTPGDEILAIATPEVEEDLRRVLE